MKAGSLTGFLAARSQPPPPPPAAPMAEPGLDSVAKMAKCYELHGAIHWIEQLMTHLSEMPLCMCTTDVMRAGDHAEQLVAV